MLQSKIKKSTKSLEVGGILSSLFKLFFYLLILLSIFLLYRNIIVLKKETKRIEKLERKIEVLSDRVDSLEFKLGVGTGLEKEKEKYLTDTTSLMVLLPRGYRKKIIDELERDLPKITKQKPVLGGEWYITSAKFISPDVILVDYEDGHIARRMIVRRNSYSDATLWSLLYDMER